MALIWDSLDTFICMYTTSLTLFFYLEVVAIARSCLHSSAQHECGEHCHVRPLRNSHTLGSFGETWDLSVRTYTLWWVWSHGWMFQCLRSSVQRRKHGSVKIHTVHTTVSSSDHISIPDIFAVILIAPSSYSCVCFRTCLWTCGEFTVGFGLALLFILHSVFNLSQECCVQEDCTFLTPVLITKSETLTNTFYFPHALNTDTGNLEARKLSSIPMFIFQNHVFSSPHALSMQV